MVISKKTIIFKGFRGGPTFSRGEGNFFQGGGVQWVISIETHITCDFQGGGDPISPSGSAHAISQFIFLISKGNISCGFPKDPSQEDDSFEHQNKCLDLYIRKYSQFYAEKLPIWTYVM